ncbi:MAG: DUF1857 family protein [Pigmentiphaga sp.]|nr:DUF1857 family protein [Pigmentiphaga sp.]
MLTFEHLVQLNDDELPLSAILSRADVWNGLYLRAHQPTEFVIGLDSCTILSEQRDGDVHTLERLLDFGPFKVQDTVTLITQQKIVTVVEANADFPRSEYQITIEEPEPGQLFLRFLYVLDLDVEDTEIDHMTNELRKQAYYASDLDTVQRIRELVANGRSFH